MTIRLTNASFEEAVSCLARNLNRPIIADGYSRNRVTLAIDGAAEDCLASVCRAYGFQSRIAMGGITVLTKSCERPDDLPQMNLAEMQHLARSILACLRSLPFDLRPGMEVQSFSMLWNSLSDAQREQLLVNRRISVKELTDRQSALAVGAVSNYILPLTYQAWTALELQLRELGGSVVVPVRNPGSLRRADRIDLFGRRGLRLLSLELSQPKPQHKSRIDPQVFFGPSKTSKPIRLQDGGGSIHGVFAGLEPAGNADARVTLECGPLALDELATSISERSGIKVVPAPYLRGRIMTIAAQRVPLATFFRALCDLEGWTLDEASDGALRLFRKQPVPAKSLSVAARQIAELLPPDVAIYIGRIEGWRRTVHLSASDISGAPGSVEELTRGLASGVAMRLAALVDGRNRLTFGDVPDDLREDLIRLLMLRSIEGSKPALLSNRLERYEADPTTASLRLRQNGYLEIGQETRLPGGRSSYLAIGVPVIQQAQQPGPPFRFPQ